MKCLFLKIGRLSFFFIILLAIYSCKKDGSVDEQNENLHLVNFKVSGFSSAIKPFKAASKANAQALSNTSATQNYVEGKLYFWSFNKETLEPDIAYQIGVKPSITYLKGTNIDERNPNIVGSGYKYEDYIAGGAISCDGPSEILIKIPIQGADQITQFGFDAGSSNTGPKDFELYYSIDEGKTYEVIQRENQFGDTKASTKNSYNYLLSDKNIISSQLWFKFLPKEGIRGDGGAYNSTSGTFRFDNIRLLGMAPSSQTGNSINKLHYFLFHKDKPETVVTGSVAYEEASSLSLNLVKGSYSIFFVSNESRKDLLFPESPTRSNFYIGNIFANSNAEVFGYVGNLEVTGDIENEIRLQRLFSQVKFEFTDATDLSVIKRIGISQRHDPFFLAPFNSQLANPILDQSDVEIVADFNTNKQLIFNQFMGISSMSVPLKYEVVLYGDTGILRTFQVESTLKNNMQLVFRGDLLKQLNVGEKFQVFKHTDWGGEKEEGF